jgi:hypothetical protein
LGGGNDKVNSSETLGSVSNGQSSRQSTPTQAASTLYSQVKEIKAHGFAFSLSFFCLLALLCAPFAGCEEQVLLFLIKGQRCECSKIKYYLLFPILHTSHTHYIYLVPIQTGAPAQIRAADRPSGTPAVLPSRYVASVDHTGLLRRSATAAP